MRLETKCPSVPPLLPMGKSTSCGLHQHLIIPGRHVGLFFPVAWGVTYVFTLLEQNSGTVWPVTMWQLCERSRIVAHHQICFTGRVICHLSTLFQTFNFQGEQKSSFTPLGVVVMWLSFGPLQCKSLCCSFGHISHIDICVAVFFSFSLLL